MNKLFLAEFTLEYRWGSLGSHQATRIISASNGDEAREKLLKRFSDLSGKEEVTYKLYDINIYPMIE